MHQINISIHVIAGVLALCVGIISYASIKGERVHRRYGRIFLGLMGVVILTATIGVVFFRDRPFLTVITIQSFYMATSGFRALKYKQQGPGIIDLGLVVLLLGAGGLFVWDMQTANIVWDGRLVYYLLTFLFAVGVYDVLRIFNVINWPNAWLPEHFLKMTSAYTALFSAGMGTVLPNLGAYTQIVSAMMGTALLIGVIWRFRDKFRRVKVSS